MSVIATLVGCIGETVILCTSLSIENDSVVPLRVNKSCSLVLVDVMLLSSVLTMAPPLDIE
jgi:hypothetical protein